MCRTKTFIKITVSLFLFCCTASQAFAVRVSFTNPTIDEQVLGAGRDFYIIGTIDREGKKASECPIDIKIEVAITGEVREGIIEPVRTVRSRVDRTTGVTPERDIFFNYGGKAPWVSLSREELAKSPPPDLIFHHENPKSFYDPRIKAVVTENSFAVLVQGGCTKNFDTDYREIYKEDLEWKLYRVLLTVMSGDIALEEHGVALNNHSFDIMFGSVQEKILARFSPSVHMAKVEKFANERGIRVYKDLFPGYWNVGLPSTYEIPLRWRDNDGLEYISGKIHAIMYNIPLEQCASQTVEIGRIAFEGFIESEEIVYYYYDIGEPSLNIKTFHGEEEKEGKIIAFDHGDRLQFTRAEFSNNQNYSPCRVIDGVDTNVYNAVAVDRGNPLTLYGVVTPIQPLLSKVIPNDDGTFTVGNRIAKLRYNFVNMIEGTLYSDEKTVLLERFFDPKDVTQINKSIYEFRHSFQLPKKMDGKIVTVEVKGYDLNEEIVDGTEEKFYLWIR